MPIHYAASISFLLVTLVLSEVAGFKQVDYESNIDHTHDTISREALDQAAAIYIATVLRPGHYDLTNQTANQILRSYFKEVPSAQSTYDVAVVEIIEGIGVAMGKKQGHPKLTMNNEMIGEGNNHLNVQRQQIIKLSKDTTPSWTAIRMLVGEYLFTLQDFYSNTNWIELGHGVLHSLGWNNSLPFPVAKSDQPTCRSCEQPNANSTGTCNGNLLNNGNTLTSGYIDSDQNSTGGIKPYDPRWPKGEGKCSHGGQSDYSHVLPATGGINKESLTPMLSPHYYLHLNASAVATKALTYFFTRNESSLLTSLGFERLGQLLGLDQGNSVQSACVNCNDPSVSIVFVIDTTGSMAKDIFQVRQKAVEIVTKAMMPGFSPANYLLATFNDPASLTTYQISTDGEDVKRWLNALTVSGGDDCPEYAMSGLKTAMEHANNGSCVFLFTDADPKDPELLGDVQNLMRTKDLHLVSFITGQCDGNLNTSSGGNVGCITKTNHHRRKRGWGNVFQTLGGTFIPVKDRDISKPLDKLLEKNMAIKYVNNFTSSLTDDILEILVDSHITAFTVEIISSSSSPTSALKRPDGSVETFSGKSSFNDIGRNTFIMSIVGPSAGIWVLENKGVSNWKITVKEQGDIQFTYRFLERHHGALLPVHGSPLAGSSLKLLVTVDGLDAGDSLLYAVLLDESRSEILRLNLTQSTQGLKRLGTVTFKVPNKTFRIAIEGKEKLNRYRRESSDLIKPSSASIRFINYDGNIYVDKDVTISCEIKNEASSTETFQIKLTDTAGFIDPSKSVTTTVNGGSLKVVPIAIRGKRTHLTTILTAHLILRGQEIQRQQLVLMVQTSIPPIIQLVNQTRHCKPLVLNYYNCTQQKIYVSTNIVTSRAAKVYTKPILHVTSVVSGSGYSVNISGSCCTPKFTVFVVDNQTQSTEQTFDFTNGCVFSTVIPVKETRTTQTSKKNNNQALIVYGSLGGIATFLVIIGTILVIRYLKSKKLAKVESEIFQSNSAIHNGPRMPRSHLRYFRR